MISQHPKWTRVIPSSIFTNIVATNDQCDTVPAPISSEFIWVRRHSNFMSQAVWHLLQTEDGRPYYYNRAKKVTQWDRPDGFVITEEDDAVDEQLEEKKLLIPKKKKKKVWVKKSTATFGSDTDSEHYYLNTQSGETQWDRPTDYESEDEATRHEDSARMTFDPNQNVMQILEELGCLNSNEMSLDREKMFMTGNDEDDSCSRRLEQMLLAVKYAGTMIEWSACIEYHDSELVKQVLLHWGGCTTKVRGLVCVLLEHFIALEKPLVRRIVNGEWGFAVDDFMANVSLGLSECTSNVVLYAWLSLVYTVLTEIPNLNRDSLPNRKTLDIVISCFECKDEDVFLMACFATIAFNSHFGFAEDAKKIDYFDTGDEDLTANTQGTPNIVVQALQAKPKAETYFGEALLKLLNDQRYPYTDPVLLGQLLYMLRTLFACSQSSDFFLVNDMKILIDTIIAQVEDLPQEDEFRIDYIRLLYLIIANSLKWRKDTKRYGRAHILRTLDSTLDARERGMHPLACKYALRILLDCVAELQ